MYIESFHIDGFGVFSGLAVEALSPGLTVFLGENEAGKSTCLEFLRTTLAGYPNKKSKAWKPFVTLLQTNNAGGSLALRLHDGDELRLTRRPGPNGGLLTLGGQDGQPLPATYLNTLLRGVNHEVYNAVFGFSLSELQIFESLSAPGVRDALYSASFGPGLASPAVVLAGLGKEMENIFKPGGSNPSLNANIRELEEIRRKLEELRLQSAAYNDLARDLERGKNDLAEVRRKKAALEEEERRLAKRLGVWRQWQDRHVALARLERLEAVRDDFPEDGPTRLASLETARENCERQLTAHREKCSRLEQQIGNIRVNTDLLEALPLLRGLSGRTNACREALTLLPGQGEECRRAAGQLKAELVCLGRGWTCGRIRATDRTLFTREDIEKLVRAMTAADLTHSAALDVLNKANQEVSLAEQSLARELEALNLLPRPQAALNEEERDNARQALDRRENNLRALPERRKNIERARAMFARSFEPLGLKAADDPSARLETVLAGREEAQSVAQEVLERQREAEKMEDAARLAENQVQNLKLRKKLHLEELQRNPLASRENLEKKERDLNDLRGKSATLDMEQSRLDELSARIDSETPPTPVRSLPLMIIGLALALAGAGMLLAHWQLGITSYALTERLDVPVTLWSGYLILVCGAAFLGGGLPRSGPEAKRHKQRMAQLGKARETLAEHVAHLEEQTGRICEVLGIANRDPVTLDAVALRLKEERENIVLGEQNRRVSADLERDLHVAIEACNATVKLREQHMNAKVQQVRRRWQDIMQVLGAHVVPSAEGAGAFFARAETARVALLSLQEAEAALEELEADTRAQECLLRALEPVASLAGNPEDGDALARSARDVLESCRAADAAREERIKAEAAAQGKQSALDDSRARRDEAASALREAGVTLAEARQHWSGGLKKLGLAVSLEPDAVREAFNRMDKCLAAEERLLRAVAERKRSRGAVRALRGPLTALLTKLDKIPQKDVDGADDWPASLETGLEAAERALAASGERESLDRLLTEEREALRLDESALDDVRTKEAELFARAGARDGNDLLRLHRIRGERFELTRNIQQHEDMLRLAAGNEVFEEFLASFRNADQEELEQRGDAIRQDMKSVGTEEAALEAGATALGGKVRTLECADELAVLQQREASLLESMEAKAREWTRLALARELLSEAKAVFEQERQPRIVRLASQIFADITRRWRGISVSLDDASLSILPVHGAPVPPEVLSRGAQEQAYLALRLAYIVNHSAEAEPLPVIMDEILVNFDPGRAERTARAFADLTEGRAGKKQQLLYFTCQPHMVDILRKAVPGAALYSVRNGGIQSK